MKLLVGKESDYQEWRAKNDDPYSRACFIYAEAWADLLEKRIPEGASDAQVTRVMVNHADTDSHIADTEGITRFMFGMAVSILARVWIYGEQLRHWYNLKVQIGDEGEKANQVPGRVLNPALLNVG